jgi:tetratricopeptide (TPR) repeat protein
MGVLKPTDAMPKAREAAKRAVAIAPDLADGFASLGVIATYYDLDQNAAKELFDVALSLGPDSPDTLLAYGRYLTWLEGNHEAALEAYERALVLNPLDMMGRCLRAYAHYNAGDLERAFAEFTDILAVEPNSALAHYGVGDTYLCSGRLDEAIPELKRAIELGGRASLYIGALARTYGLSGRVDECKQLIEELESRIATGSGAYLNTGIAHSGLGDLDTAFEWWNRGVRERDLQMIYLVHAPMVDPYRSDPRFKELLEKMGLGHFNR